MLPKSMLLNQRVRPNPFINDNIRSLINADKRSDWLRVARQKNPPAIWSGHPAKFQRRSQTQNSTGTKGIRRRTK